MGSRDSIQMRATHASTIFGESGRSLMSASIQGEPVSPWTRLLQMYVGFDFFGDLLLTEGNVA